MQIYDIPLKWQYNLTEFLSNFNIININIFLHHTGLISTKKDVFVLEKCKKNIIWNIVDAEMKQNIFFLDVKTKNRNFASQIIMSNCNQ